MRWLLFLIFIFILPITYACECGNTAAQKSKFFMECEKVEPSNYPSYILRCENQEVVCYIESSHRSPYCFKKENLLNNKVTH